MSILKEFKEFALRGNVLDMAVGIIIGAAFTTVVNSLVQDILTPPLALLQGSASASDLAGVTIPLSSSGEGAAIKIGAFANNVIQFAIVAFAVFLLIRAVNRLARPAPAAAAPAAAPTTRECPYCITEISVKAVKCPNCTSDVSAEVAASR